MSSAVRMMLAIGIVLFVGWGIVRAGEMQWTRGRIVGERLMSIEMEKEQARQAAEHAALVSSVILLDNLFDGHSDACERSENGQCVLHEDVWKKHRIQFTQTGIAIGARSYRFIRNRDGKIVDIELNRTSSVVETLSSNE